MRFKGIRLIRNAKKISLGVGTGFLIFILFFWKLQNDQEPEIFLNNWQKDSSSIEQTYQSQLDYIAKYMDIKVIPISNEHNNFYHNLEVTNLGDKPIATCCWTIYFYSPKYFHFALTNLLDISLLTSQEQKNILKHNTKFLTFGNADNTSKITLSCSFNLSHVVGYTYKLKPTFPSNSLPPKHTITSRIIGSGWLVAKSDFIPNWYVANDQHPDTVPRVIAATKDLDSDLDEDNHRIFANSGVPFVKEFTSQTSVRFERDQYRPFTAQTRFKANEVPLLKCPPHLITPTPLLLTRKRKDVDGDEVKYESYHFSDWTIHHKLSLLPEAQYLQDKLNVTKALKTAEKVPKSDKNVILLTLENSTRFERKIDEIVSEKNFKQANYQLSSAYQLSIDKHRIGISAVSSEGIFHAITSLLHLLHNHRMSTQQQHTLTTLPSVTIFDAARFGHRGVMIDVSRNFQSLASLRRLVRVMATYKLNVLHLHLSDDEAWRLELPGLPELTQVGACRGHDVGEKDCLMSMLGSGPGSNSSNSNSKKVTKFYRVKEFQRFLRYATSHHVKVVPEFDMPSHSHAALMSMKARHRRFAERRKRREAMKFVLHDLQDTSEYMTGQYYTQSAINPCLHSTYTFVKHVIASVVQIYKDHNPLTHFHLGGDEVSDNAFSASPLCADLKAIIEKKTGKEANAHDLKTFFVRKVAAMALRFNLSVIGWQDAFNNADGSFMKFKPSSANSSTHVVAQYYYNNWLGGYGDIPHNLANNDMKVILSPVTHLYLDSPQEPNPDDLGLHWASRYLNTKRVFSFTAQNVLNSMEEDFEGNEISRREVCARVQCLPLLKHHNILGMEAALWSELVRTEGRMHQMLFPRLLALAERSWSRAGWEEDDNKASLKERMNRDWKVFANRVGAFELQRLEQHAIKYYVPKPGAHIEDGILYINTMFPGMRTQLLLDGPGNKWLDVRNGLKLQASLFGAADDALVTITLTTISFNGRQRSSPVRLKHQFRH